MAVHFEYHVGDTARARSFYTGLFGWAYQPMPGMDYHLVIGDGIGIGQPISGALMARNAPGRPTPSATATATPANVPIPHIRMVDVNDSASARTRMKAPATDTTP